MACFILSRTSNHINIVIIQFWEDSKQGRKGKFSILGGYDKVNIVIVNLKLFNLCFLAW
jgi:hypothetical protein